MAHPIADTRDRKYQIQRLQERNREILRYHMAGLKNTEIADSLGITTATVCNTINSMLGQNVIAGEQAERDERVRNIRTEFEKLAVDALEIYQTVLADGESRLRDRLNVCRDVLDRVVPKRTEALTISGTLTSQDIEELKSAAVSGGIDVQDIDLIDTGEAGALIQASVPDSLFGDTSEAGAARQSLGPDSELELEQDEAPGLTDLARCLEDQVALSVPDLPEGGNGSEKT